MTPSAKERRSGKLVAREERLPWRCNRPQGAVTSGGENQSLGNRSRDDKTAIELIVAGVRGWGAGLRRELDNCKPKED